ALGRDTVVRRDEVLVEDLVAERGGRDLEPRLERAALGLEARAGLDRPDGRLLVGRERQAEPVELHEEEGEADRRDRERGQIDRTGLQGASVSGSQGSPVRKVASGSTT